MLGKFDMVFGFDSRARTPRIPKRTGCWTFQLRKQHSLERAGLQKKPSIAISMDGHEHRCHGQIEGINSAEAPQTLSAL